MYCSLDRFTTNLTCLSLAKTIGSARYVLQENDSPNYVGSLDGKQCRINCPSKARLLFYNSKQCHSLFLLVKADTDCTFICVDVGTLGVTYFGRAVLKNVPDVNSNFPDSNSATPLVIMADDSYPLRQLIRPSPLWDSRTNRNFQLQAADNATN